MASRARRGGSGRRSAARVKKFFEKEAGETLRIVADDGALFKKVTEDGAEAKLIQLGEIDDNRTHCGLFRRP